VAPAAKASGILRTEGDAGGLSLGLFRPAGVTTTTTTLRLTNTSWCPKLYKIATRFRDAADAATGAVRIDTPGYVLVPGRRTVSVPVTVRTDPARLSAWPFTYSAGLTGDGAKLDAPEYDGYLTAVTVGETLSLPWTLLPQRSAAVTAGESVTLTEGAGTLTLANASTVQAGDVDIYGLTGTSPQLPAPAPGEPGSAGSNSAVIDRVDPTPRNARSRF
jgi:hypothetical protein